MTMIMMYIKCRWADNPYWHLRGIGVGVGVSVGQEKQEQGKAAQARIFWLKLVAAHGSTKIELT